MSAATSSTITKLVLKNKIFLSSFGNYDKSGKLIKPDLIIHHKNCPDGTAAAWSAKKIGGSRCKSLPTAAGTNVDINDILTRKCIWYVDISPTLDFIHKLHDEYIRAALAGSPVKFPRITIIDHHESFKTTIQKLIDDSTIYNFSWLSIYYDNDRSGCQLAWDYINLYTTNPTIPLCQTDKEYRFKSPNSNIQLKNQISFDVKIDPSDSSPYTNSQIYIDESIADNNNVKLLFDNRPWFINYTGERDLWRFNTLSDCKEINTALYANCGGAYTYKYYDTLNLYNQQKQDELSEYLEKLTNQGKEIIENNNKIINKSAENAKHLKFYDDATKTTTTTPTYNIWLVELDAVSYQLRSEIGNFCTSKLFDDGTEPDFAVCVQFIPDTNVWRFACRGADKVNLSHFCAKFGGGGHPNASGFELPPGKHYSTIFK